MKKILNLFLVVMLILSAVPAFAAVGLKIGVTPTGTCTDLAFTGNVISNNGSTCTIPLQLAGSANGGAASMSSNDTDVSPSYAFIRKNIGFSAQAGTLADGSPGQMLTILISQEVATGSFVLTPTTKTGYASLTFDNPGDLATLLFVDSTIGWVLVAGNALTVNQ